MPTTPGPRVPTPSAEHRRAAAGQFERANQVIATGNYDYGIQLLMSCCQLDPGNLIYRQALRRTEKTKYNNNLRGSLTAGLTAWTTRAKVKAALRGGDYLKVLVLAEKVLARNPWNTGAQMDMAEAADALGLLDLAVWTLEQARQKDAKEVKLNRALARLYEKRGNFSQAIALWEIVRKADPTDVEAQSKSKDLAANETIARGHYKEAIAQNARHPGAAGAAGMAGGSAQVGAGASTSPPAGGPAAGGAPAAPAPRARPGGSPSGSDTHAALSPTDRHARETAALRSRVEADPANPAVYLQLAAHLRKAGLLDQARLALAQGVAATGNAFELTCELADLEIESLRRDLAHADERLRAEPDDDELRGLRDRLAKEINSRELELYRLKADRFPTEMAHRFELGVRLMRAGQVDEAIKELQAARADPRHHWRALLYLAYCFKNRQNWRLAKRNFDECLQNLPAGEDAVRKEVLFQLATGSAEAGDLAAAIDLGHELANLDFGFRNIGQLLDKWQKQSGNKD